MAFGFIDDGYLKYGRECHRPAVGRMIPSCECRACVRLYAFQGGALPKYVSCKDIQKMGKRPYLDIIGCFHSSFTRVNENFLF